MRTRTFVAVVVAVLCGNLLASGLAPRHAEAGGWGLSESAERMARALERIANQLEKRDCRSP